MRFNRLGELLPGRMSGSRLLPNRGPILRRAEPSFQRVNHPFIWLLGGDDDMFDGERCRLFHGGVFLSRWCSLNLVLTARLLRISTLASTSGGGCCRGISRITKW